MKPKIVDVGDGDGQVPVDKLTVHNEQATSSYHHALATMTYPEFPMPIGVIREVPKESYDHMAVEQVKQAEAENGRGELGTLLRSGMTWRVDDDGVPHHD
jgi:2-oxoglutarate ferredoxin oxidoreductase subunit beta